LEGDCGAGHEGGNNTKKDSHEPEGSGGRRLGQAGVVSVADRCFLLTHSLRRAILLPMISDFVTAILAFPSMVQDR
jgi:hypothetical protein